MEQTVAKGDMIEYVWYTRNYYLISISNPIVGASVRYCPFCGKGIGSLSLLQQYEKACDQPEAAKIDWQSKTEVEAFNERFLAEQREKEQHLKALANSSEQTEQSPNKADTA